MNEAMRDARAATIAAAAGIGGPAVTLVGIALVQLSAPPMVGFLLFQLGILLGLTALVAGGIGLYATREGAGAGGRTKALIGVGLGVVMIAVVFVSAGPGANVPAINDITTNLADPPGFAPAPEGHRNVGRDMSYPEDFVAAVEAAYPDLAPIELAIPRDAAYRRSLDVAKSLGWDITRDNPEHGTFEAEDTTKVWRFVDDISVRVRTTPTGGATIDIRSKSRDGKGDLGANANRIRAFAAAVRK